jgi:hypothetical protein
MRKYYILLTANLFGFFALIIITNLVLYSGNAVAAPVHKSNFSVTQQTSEQRSYISVPSVAFMPVSQNTRPYNRIVSWKQDEFESPMLTLKESSENNSWFLAPLNLPHNSTLTGISFYGEAKGDAGQIGLVLLQCEHNGGCENLFEQVANTNHVGKIDSGTNPIKVQVNNEFYSYVLGLKITTSESGLRSVRLEITEGGEEPSPVIEPAVENWFLEEKGVSIQPIIGISASAIVKICNSPDSVPVRVYGDGQKFSVDILPGNCSRISGYSTYKLEHIGFDENYWRDASGIIEFQ